MARSGGTPAAEVDFSDRNQARGWFEHQTREACIALAMRSALRVLPLIDDGRRHFLLDYSAMYLALPVLRACFVTWAIGKYPARHDRLRGCAVTAANATRTASDYALFSAAHGDAAAMADGIDPVWWTP